MQVERWGWYSVAINIILAAINAGLALASGSLAVRAEMIHNFVDLLTAIGVLVGLKLSTRKSKAFPYGLYKLENVVTVVLAGMTFLTAYEIASEALFSTTDAATVDLWMLAGVVIATAIPLVFSHFELRAGLAANSPALIADAKEYRAHVFTTGTVFAALLAQWFNLPLDRFAAMVIVVAIAKTGWDLLSDGMRVLLDASLDPDTILQIREILTAEPAVADLKWVTGRNAGRYRFVETELTLRVRELEQAAAITRDLEDRIRAAVPFIERVLIHAEPEPRTHLRYAVPLAGSEDAISPHFGDAPFFALVTVRLADGVVENQEIVANPHLAEKKAKGIRVAEWLIGLETDVVLVKESLQGKGPVYAFGDAAVELRETDAETLREMIEIWIQRRPEESVPIPESAARARPPHSPGAP